MKKITTLLLFCAFSISCTKQIDTSEIELAIVYTQIVDSKAKADRCSKAVPVVAIIETDKGVLSFPLTLVSGGASGNIEVEYGKCKIISVNLYDEERTLTHYVHQGKPSNNGSIVGMWVDGYEYDFTNDSKLMFQVICN